MISDEILDLDEAADYLKLGRHSLYKLVQQNRVPAHKVGRRWRFRRSVLDDWLRENSISSLHNVAPSGGFLSSLSALTPYMPDASDEPLLESPGPTLEIAQKTPFMQHRNDLVSTDVDQFMVLVADDDPGVRAALRIHIERAGFTVHEAENGTAAIERVANLRATASATYSHIFTDLHMPGIGGTDLVQQLKQASPTTILVVVTGYADDLVRLDLATSWPIIIIPKPFRGAQVRDALRLIARKLPDENGTTES